MILSKVIRRNRAHITRADYSDTKPLLDSENVMFPEIDKLEARVLKSLFVRATLSHREFDFSSSSYRLGSFIDTLRTKGWTIVNHDEVMLTSDIVPRTAKYTRYELYADFTEELNERIKAFCRAVDDFVARAATPKAANLRGGK